MSRSYRISVIRGDGIGPEIVEATEVLLDHLSDTFDFLLEKTYISAGARHYVETGENISASDLDLVDRSDATLKGPAGLPEIRYPDGTEAGLLGGQLRGILDLFANVRPITLLPGVEAKLRVEPGDVDYVIVRENTQGLYASRGKAVGDNDAMVDTMFVTRAGSERVFRYAFEHARGRNGAPEDGVTRVTCIDKANVLGSMYFFRRIFLEIAEEYPNVEAEYLHVDAAAQSLVLMPEHFDVIVTENLFGDVLSDLGAATVGGIGLAPSGNIGTKTAVFEPIHGSAPSIAGESKANPIGQILSAAMMLEYLGEHLAGQRLRAAVHGALQGQEIKIESDGSIIGGSERVLAALTSRL